jgi:hypothetical protein
MIHFNGRELDALMEASAKHYDGVCKAAGKVGGFLYGMVQRFGGTEPVTAATMATLSRSECDILCKICECEELYGTETVVSLKRAVRLLDAFGQLQTTVQHIIRG